MHSAVGHAHISTGVKKHFMFLEELNRTICENGLNFRLFCIYFFKNISQLPGHFIKHSILCFLPGFPAFIQWLWPLFQGFLLPLTFLPAATLDVYHFLDKNKGKNIVLTEHSVNLPTNLSVQSKGCLSHAGVSSEVSYFWNLCTALIVPWQ